jgi:hypothetical protein
LLNKKEQSKLSLLNGTEDSKGTFSPKMMKKLLAKKNIPLQK